VCLSSRRGYGRGYGVWQKCSVGMLSAMALRSVLGASLQIAVPSEPLAQGSTVAIPIAFAAEGSAVCGIQFDLNYDPSTLEIQFTAGENSERAGKQVYTAALGDAGRRFIIVGVNTQVFEDGVVLDVQVNIKVLGDDSNSVMPALSNAAATDADGQAVPILTVVTEPTRKKAPRMPPRAQNAGSTAGAPTSLGSMPVVCWKSKQYDFSHTFTNMPSRHTPSEKHLLSLARRSLTFRRLYSK
jgi:hypothetical protein